MSADNGNLSDNEKLMIAVFSQLFAIDGTTPPPDFSKLAEDLGLTSMSAARNRWYRFSAKIRNAEFGDLKVATNARTARKRSKTDAELEGEEAGLDSPSKLKKLGVDRKTGRKDNDMKSMSGGMTEDAAAKGAVKSKKQKEMSSFEIYDEASAE